MEDLSTTKLVLPIAIVLGAIVIVAVFSVTTVQNVKKECSAVENELDVCQQSLDQKEKNLGSALERLNITLQDLTRYDEIYEETAGKAANLSQQLREEQNKSDTVIIYNAPYRSVPNHDAFSKAVRLELMLERLESIKELYGKEYVNEGELRLIVGQMYVLSWEFQQLFIEDGVQVGLGEEAQELYRKNNDLLSELQGYYSFFDEQNQKKMKTRLGHILILQENLIKGMQTTYWLR